jgi:hypothetical protein
MVKLTGYFRFTDFLVNEVGLDGEVLRLKSIGKPVDPYDVPKDKSKGKEKDKEKEKPEAVAAPSTSEPEAVKEEPKQEAVQAEIASINDPCSPTHILRRKYRQALRIVGRRERTTSKSRFWMGYTKS